MQCNLRFSESFHGKVEIVEIVPGRTLTVLSWFGWIAGVCAELDCALDDLGVARRATHHEGFETEADLGRVRRRFWSDFQRFCIAAGLYDINGCRFVNDGTL